VAAELAVLEASLADEAPSDDLLSRLDEVRQRLPFDDSAREYLLASPAYVLRRVLPRLEPKDGCKAAGKADYSALVISVTKKFRLQARMTRLAAARPAAAAHAPAVRRARRAAALGPAARRDREDTLLLLVSGAQVLPWPRIRELLLS